MLSSRATVITYVGPVVALALGVAVLGEDVTAGAVTGRLPILAGSCLATDGRLTPRLGGIAARLAAMGRGQSAYSASAAARASR